MSVFGRFNEWLSLRMEASRQRKLEFKKKQLVEKAEEMFDVTVYEGNMWFVVDGELVVPMSCFNEDEVGLIQFVREEYVKRNLEK
jgi:hypothetical protein